MPSLPGPRGHAFRKGHFRALSASSVHVVRGTFHRTHVADSCCRDRPRCCPVSDHRRRSHAPELVARGGISRSVLAFSHRTCVHSPAQTDDCGGGKKRQARSVAHGRRSICAVSAFLGRRWMAMRDTISVNMGVQGRMLPSIASIRGCRLRRRYPP